MRITDSRGFFVRALYGSATGLAPAFFRLLMVPAAAVYGTVTWLRRRFYRRGVLPVGRLGVPVVSVGNLTSGGTGKTPVVEWVVRWLLRNGGKPAVLSRGYGGTVTSAAPGKNDEALMLARSLPGVPHYPDPDRLRAGRSAVAAGADCLVLDDGFQHLRVHRDVNLALIDALDPFGGGWVLPAGTLRESVSCLREADAVILTRVDTVSESELGRLRERLHRLAPQVVLCETTHRPTHLVTVGSTETEPPERIAGRKVFLFCGIGNPRGFLRTVERLAAEPVAVHFLPDHFSYRREDLARIAEDCTRAGAEVALTTEKDAVKIGGKWPGRLPLLALRVEIDFTAGQEQLEALLKNGLTR